MSHELARNLSFEGPDSAGKKSTIRRFYVEATWASALADPIVPPPNSQHPDDPALIVDNFGRTSIPEKPDHTYVDVYYSNSRRWKFANRVEHLEPSYKGSSFSFSTTVVSIPFGYRKTVLLPNTAVPTPVKVWAVGEMATPEVNIVIQRVVNASSLSLGDLETIRAQANVLHKIGAKYYRFEPGFGNESDKNKWKITYNWHGDAGTLYPTNHVSTLGLLPAGLAGYPGFNPQTDYFLPLGIEDPLNEDGQLYMRPSFSKFTVIPSDNPTLTKPMLLPHFHFKINNDGWQNLPGSPAW